MSITITLPLDVQNALVREAWEQKVRPEVFALDLLRERLGVPAATSSNDADQTGYANSDEIVNEKIDQKPGVLSLLAQMKVQGPPDLSENLALYAHGVKRFAPDDTTDFS